MLRCNLPPALLAEWPGYFTCHCGDKGVERTPNESQHKKLTLEKKIPLPFLPGLEPAAFRSGVRLPTGYPGNWTWPSCEAHRRGNRTVELGGKDDNNNNNNNRRINKMMTWMLLWTAAVMTLPLLLLQLPLRFLLLRLLLSLLVCCCYYYCYFVTDDGEEEEEEENKKKKKRD